MPNFTYNTLIVTGDTENLRTFKKNARSAMSALSLSALYPMPVELKGTNAEDEGPNWYRWSIENWGTKWDVDGKLVAEYEDSLEYAFRSAWNPPLEWLQKVSRDYPELRFRLRYVEECDDFTGIAQVQNGHIDDRRLELSFFNRNKRSLTKMVSDVATSVVEACGKMTQRIWSLLPEGR